MLLAFFIVLNALSDFQDSQAERIIGNLNLTFSTTITDNIARPSIRPDDETGLTEGQGEITYLDELRDLFEAHITGVDVLVNEDEGVMMLRIPVAQLNAAALDLGRPARDTSESDVADEFLPTLISMLRTGEQGRAYRMELMLESERDLISQRLEAPETHNELRDLIGGIASRLIDAGLPRETLSIGMVEGEGGMVTILFSPFGRVDLPETVPEAEEPQLQEIKGPPAPELSVEEAASDEL